MLLGIKSKKILLAHHAFIGFLAILIVYLFWLSRPELSFDVRLWRALGDTAFSFLFFTLAIGPLAKLWPPALKLLPWRREMGIWFALLALTHFIRVNDFALSEPSIELPRLLGYVALFLTIVLMATSSDKAVNFLGASSWKWLHSFAYVIFYLIALHAGYFLFFYSPKINWFQYLFLGMALTVPALQISAFIKTVRQQRAAGGESKLNSKIIQLPIIKQKIIADKTNEVALDLSKNEFAFHAGQYVQMRIPKLLYPDPKGTSRVFSVASSPNNKKVLSFAFRDSGSGFKRTLMELPIGSLVNIEGPAGFFTLPANRKQLIVFIAGGIGITPCLSMIRFATEEKLAHPITLLYANRNKECTAYLEKLTKIAQKNPRFSLINKFGRIDADFIQQYIKNLNEPIWYVVGPPPMVAAMRDTLSHLNIDSGKIYFENFYGY